MQQERLKIIQISDIHLCADSSVELLGVRTEDSFNAVLALIKQETTPPDLILLTGDLSQDGSKKSYIRLATLLEPLQVPMYYIAGNHDHIAHMDHVFPRDPISKHKHIILKNWHLILLNSQKPGAVAGELDQTQLDFLQSCLEQYPEHQAIIALHHQPVPVGSLWIDKIGLLNADTFWKIISNFSKVHTVLFGHVHQEYAQEVNGVACYGTPSTCIQFKRQKNDFALENLPPGYRWIELYQEGSIVTGVKRVPEYMGFFDANAKGY